MTTSVKRYALDEFERVLGLVTAANGYQTTVAAVHTSIFGREDARRLGALPALGFMAGRSTVQYDGFGEMRCVVPMSVTAIVAAPDWTTGADALDKLEDDVIVALMNAPVLTNGLISIQYTGSEDDTGSPDTMDSAGGTMALVMFFDVVYRRGVTRSIA